MKNLAVVFALVSTFALSAQAEELNITSLNGKPVVQLHALDTGASADLFAILKKAGFPGQFYGEGESYVGKVVSASVAYMNGANFNAAFEFDRGSSDYKVFRTTTSSTLTLVGAAAEELFEAMVKAGSPLDGQIGRVGMTSYRQGAVRCSEATNMRPVGYSCQITVKR